MPGIATPQLLNYAEIVDVDLDATNDVNFADVEDYGHRVVVQINTAALNDYLGWERAVGSARPSAKLNAANEAAFKGAIEAALAGGFVDIDGVTNALHFGTANLDTNPDPRKRGAEGVGANDIPLCFVLYKLYGSSAAVTLDRIYNLDDAMSMLSNSTVSTAITESFKAAEAGAVDTMFRDLLAADPHRFFDASGLPMTGIFETNADVSGAGNWKMVADDTLEIKLKMIFHSRVSRRGVAGYEHNLTATAAENLAASQANQQTVINPDDYFYIRLQLKSTPEAGAGSPSSGGSGSGVPGYTAQFINNVDMWTPAGIKITKPAGVELSQKPTGQLPPYPNAVYTLRAGEGASLFGTEYSEGAEVPLYYYYGSTDNVLIFYHALVLSNLTLFSLIGRAISVRLADGTSVSLTVTA
jgi:hypothetical protein